MKYIVLLGCIMNIVSSVAMDNFSQGLIAAAVASEEFHQEHPQEIEMKVFSSRAVAGYDYYRSARALKAIMINIAKQLSADLKNKDRIFLDPTDILLPDEKQTSQGMYLEIEAAGPISVMTPWGKWKCVRASSVQGAGDHVWREALAQCKSLEMALIARKWKKLSDDKDQLQSYIYRIHRIESVRFFPAILIKDREKYRPVDQARKEWESFKIMYETPPAN